MLRIHHHPGNRQLARCFFENSNRTQQISALIKAAVERLFNRRQHLSRLHQRRDFMKTNHLGLQPVGFMLKTPELA
ncbi:hypothetical protein D3C80_1848850 [compost metagenome]